jgi:hypothetical protein
MMLEATTLRRRAIPLAALLAGGPGLGVAVGNIIGAVPTG